APDRQGAARPDAGALGGAPPAGVPRRTRVLSQGRDAAEDGARHLAGLGTVARLRRNRRALRHGPRGPFQAQLKDDSRKVDTGFRKRSCSNNELKRDDDSQKSHHALARLSAAIDVLRWSINSVSRGAKTWSRIAYARASSSDSPTAHLMIWPTVSIVMARPIVWAVGSAPR